MSQPGLRYLERCVHGEYCLPVLNDYHPPGAERAAIADRFHIDERGDRGIPGTEKVSVQRVCEPIFWCRVGRRPQRLRHDLTTIQPPLSSLRMVRAKQALFQPFEGEQIQQFLKPGTHVRTIYREIARILSERLSTHQTLSIIQTSVDSPNRPMAVCL